MQTKTITEQPIISLRSRCYNCGGKERHIYAADLRDAEVGTLWECVDNHNCLRALRESSAEIVYKTDRGCAILLRKWGTDDAPELNEWEDDPTLIWIELAR